MIGERENINSETNYGTLIMRPYDIDGNQINAFYDSSDDLVFVLDNTINNRKPNVLLVINPDADKKWDEILSDEYNVDLETIRPKQDNKYQKLDIEYSGLNVYDNLINAYNEGRALDEELNQLNILRDSAMRHSAMTRLNVANDTISKTNTTIVKTKETIVRLQERIKTLRAKLSATKKEIGKVPTKQSASKVLKIESQIEALNDKLKRAKKRLESAQKRLEVATVDAELASDLLNQPASEIKQETKNNSVAVVPERPLQTVPEPEYEDVDEEENEDEEDDADDDNNDAVEPLFSQDPQILNEDIAFKPISFENLPAPTEEKQSQNDLPVITDVLQPVESADKDENINQKEMEIPVVTDNTDNIVKDSDNVQQENEPAPLEFAPVIEPVPVPDFVDENNNDDNNKIEQPVAERPVLETMTPVAQQPEYPVPEERPVAPVVQQPENVKPVADAYVPQVPQNVENTETKSKPAFLYYVLLVVLIILSVFTLWLYQKNVKNTTPVLTAKVETSETAPDSKMVRLKNQKKAVKATVNDDNQTASSEDEVAVFLDEVPEKPSDNATTLNKENVDITDDSLENKEPENVVPVVVNDVPAKVTTVGQDEEENSASVSEEDILTSKPVYEPGTKHDDMFIAENPEPEVVEPIAADVEYDDTEIFVDETPVDNDNAVPYDEEEAQYQAEQDEMYSE